jgi:hypothetical protein
MEQQRVSETWPGSEADVRERVLWGGDVSEEAQSELFLRKFTISSIDKEYKPIISQQSTPKTYSHPPVKHLSIASYSF